MDRKQAIEKLNDIRCHVKETSAEEQVLVMAIEALKAQTFALNNQVNLCDSCTYTYPECPSEKDDVIFGNGIGNDNICACNKYQPTIQPEPKEGHWIPHETPDGGEQYECSRCGVLWEFNDGTPEDNEAYYCPKCGIKLAIRP